MQTAAIYARVASPGEDIDIQLVELRRLGAHMGYKVVEYTDVVSGTKARRPGIGDLMRDARKGKFSVVIVAFFDRIAKSTRHFLQLVDELAGLNIEFISKQEDMGTTGKLGEQFLTVTRSLLKLYCDLNKELIKTGIRTRRLAGFKLGRKPLNVNHAALVRDRRAGLSLSACSKRYGCSRASVVRFVYEQQKQFAGTQFQPDINATAIEYVA